LDIQDDQRMNSTAQYTLSSAQMALLNRFAHRVNRRGINLAVFDERPVCVFQADAGGFHSDIETLTRLAREAFTAPFTGVRICQSNPSVAMRLLSYSGRAIAAIFIDSGQPDAVVDTKLMEFCGRHSIREQELLEILVRPNKPDDEMTDLLDGFAVEFETAEIQNGRVEKLTTELSQTYEQIMLLYNLSMHMKVTQSNAEFLQYACDQLGQLVSVEGLAIYLDKKIDGMKRLSMTAGCGYVTIDANLAEVLQVHLTSELAEGKEAMVDSNVYGPFKYMWPDNVKNVLAVGLRGGDRLIGVLVATNVLNKADFDSTDIKLFNSVANECAVFIENGRLFSDLKELFIGSLKALTNSIDAKDQYTRGHSDRVAFISRWIVEHLRQVQDVPPELIHYVYLAGLLHDIGKIGVAESVLRKQGKLTDEERGVIMAHPRIGASILSEISQMQAIVPGVLHHHERYDGKGYPQGLAGENIPLSGRIIALADTFDAMTSKRVYRDAMSLKRAIDEITKASGTQFDPEIVRVFLDSDINKLWSIIQDGFIESWDYSSFTEYGATAVGALLQ
jgi:HD-GYP domain-containing protein (c-di-GMP phosphodiesterase class II)